MARVPIHDIDTAADGSTEPLARQSERGGKTLNIFGAMAHSPALIGLYDAAEELLGERSSLDRRTREAIHLTVANVNECDYCQAAYTGAAKAAGFSEAETIGIRRGQVADDEQLNALLAVARAIAADKGTSTIVSGRQPSMPVGPRSNSSTPMPMLFEPS